MIIMDKWDMDIAFGDEHHGGVEVETGIAL